MLLEIEVTEEGLKVLSYLVTTKIGELQRNSGTKVALKLGGSYLSFRDLKTLGAYLRNRFNLRSSWRERHLIELKEKELKWIVIFAREELGKLERSGATHYGPLEIEKFKRLTEFLEKQLKAPKTVLS